jgi:hypothetical protein
MSTLCEILSCDLLSRPIDSIIKTYVFIVASITTTEISHTHTNRKW